MSALRDEVKSYIKVDGNHEDALLDTLIEAGKQYMKNATERTFDESDALMKLLLFFLVSNWYEDRSLVGRVSDTMRETAQSIMNQLTYCGGDVV